MSIDSFAPAHFLTPLRGISCSLVVHGMEIDVLRDKCGAFLIVFFIYPSLLSFFFAGSVLGRSVPCRKTLIPPHPWINCDPGLMAGHFFMGVDCPSLRLLGVRASPLPFSCNFSV